MNFSCKAMLVFGEGFQDDPNYHGSAADCWCVLTAKVTGPDGDLVELEACSDQKRGCFREY
jgi:hypothetical protein